MLTVLEKVDVLHSVDTFREIATESLSRLAAVAQEAVFAARENLFAEGSAAEALYVVLEGEIALIRSGREESVVRELQVVGAAALLADRPEPEAARTTRQTRVLRIRQSDLYEVMSEDFQITLGIVRALVPKEREGTMSRISAAAPPPDTIATR